MSTARDHVLQRIREALTDVPNTETSEDVAVARDYLTHSTTSRYEIIKQFVERVAEYRAIVTCVPENDLARSIEAACRTRGLKRIVVPLDLPDAWVPTDVERVADHDLSHQELDQVDGVITGCAIAIAQTGTIVLDGGFAQGRRAITLLPDYHLCIVFAHQVVGLVPEAFRQLSETSRRPMTFISGPSATSDIELNRVEGVHGPRTLEVLVVEHVDS